MHSNDLWSPVARSLLLTVAGSVVLTAGAAACHRSHHPTPAEMAAHHTKEHAHQHSGHKGHASPIHHRFENPEEWAEKFEGPDRDRWQKPDQVIALLELESGMTVADIGTGTGYFVPRLSRAVGENGRVLALDIEPGMVAYVKERASRTGLTNVEARQVAASDPGLPAKYVDRALIVDTWHHIADRSAYAAKLATGLRAGGAVFIVDFTMESPFGPHRKHRIQPETVIRELTAGGLVAEQVQDAGLPNQFVIVGRRAP